MRKSVLVMILMIFVTASFLHGQRVRAMDFRNRPIAEILIVLADSSGVSVILDETVTGQATFHFADSSFEDALNRFADACHLHVQEREGVWYISRIAITSNERGVSVNAEDVELEHLVRALSRASEVTILYDPLPRMQLTVFTQEQTLQEVLEILVRRLPEYSVLSENGAWYLRRQADSYSSSAAASRISSSAIRRDGDLYTVNLPRGNFSAVLTLLFSTGNREYSLLNRTESTLENLYFTGKTFDELLHLVCEQGNSDFSVTDNVYYIFEIQRRDVLKKFKETRVIELQNLSVAELNGLLPSDYSSSSFIKVSARTNSIYLTGSPEEIDPIEAFIVLAEEEAAGYQLKMYALNYLRVEDFLKLLPQNLTDMSPRTVPGSNAILVPVNGTSDRHFHELINMVDVPSTGFPIRLRFITSEELLRNLPPSVRREDLTVTQNQNLIFFTGSESRRQLFLEDLQLLDQPKPQIRYQILVIQYQKSNDFQWGSSITVNPTGSEHITGNFSNLFNINFDVISGLGHMFALQLNSQLGEDRARILADTTLNGLSGEQIRFENTNTFRYQDVALDPETGRPLYTGTTREITSGLNLGISGWVSGDGMITMQVQAAISKRDESSGNSTNPPPTSARTVNTQVRTRSGSPIIIGGLMQMEKITGIRRVPVLGHIPLLGLLFQSRTESEITTEMVIYIVPFLHEETSDGNYDRRNEGYYQRWFGGTTL
jgi:type II secretory pathway component GspD/PulD (secretin)